MAIKINGQDLQKRIINGQEVEKVMLNGVQIWPEGGGGSYGPVEEVFSYSFLDKSIQQVRSDWDIVWGIGLNEKGLSGNGSSHVSHSIDLTSIYYIKYELTLFADSSTGGGGRPSLSIGFSKNNYDEGFDAEIINGGETLAVSSTYFADGPSNITFPGVYRLEFIIDARPEINSEGYINPYIHLSANLYSGGNVIGTVDNSGEDFLKVSDIQDFNLLNIGVGEGFYAQNVKVSVGKIIGHEYVNIINVSQEPYDSGYSSGVKFTFNIRSASSLGLAFFDHRYDNWYGRYYIQGLSMDIVSSSGDLYTVEAYIDTNNFTPGREIDMFFVSGVDATVFDKYTYIHPNQ